MFCKVLSAKESRNVLYKNLSFYGINDSRPTHLSFKSSACQGQPIKIKIGGARTAE